MTHLNCNFAKLQTVLRETAFYSRKHQQILGYLPHIRSAFKNLSTQKPVVILDCGCGKSYLSFVVYQYCKTVLHRNIKIIGVDKNSDLVSKCNQSAVALGFENMHFYCSDIETFNSNETIDIVYSLHACDKATDLTIAEGVKFAARYIFSVSCCQHTNRKKLHRHPLTSISRHHPYKERLADMIGDSMRALLLEQLGYGVNIFEFVAAGYTPKNIMLRAIKDSAKNQEKNTAKIKYTQLVEMFNFVPELENLLRKNCNYFRSI
jgi:SAM-dependent methyltransferase